MNGIYMRSKRPFPQLCSPASLCLAFVLVAGALLLASKPLPAEAQEQAECEPVDLGILGDDAGSELLVDGRWTTEDCDWRFRLDTDAHVYRFRLDVGGRVRIELLSDSADSHLALFSEDGRILSEDDDGGPAPLDSLIERDLEAGDYLIEATKIGGRARGPGNFELRILRVGGCAATDLGTLEPGKELIAEGDWKLEDCGALYVQRRPAHRYRFELSQDAWVRIDLTSSQGDPVLLLLSPDTGLIDINDDDGAGVNSRIEKHLTAGTYLVEATTYRHRNRLPASEDFRLVVKLVEPDAFYLKVEDVHIPDVVIANEPLIVNYRVGNVGLSDLPEGMTATVLIYAAGKRDTTGTIAASDGHWTASASYHSGSPTMDAGSIAIDAIRPSEITLTSAGRSWIYVVVATYNELGEEIGWHGIWRNITVLSGPVFDPVTVTVDGEPYQVSAAEEGEGRVEVSVSSPEDPDSWVDPSTRAKATYAAGVHTQVLDSVFERPVIAALRDRGRKPSQLGLAQPTDLTSPTSDALLSALADGYSARIAASGLAERIAAAEMINPVSVESLTLAAAEAEWAKYLAYEASWIALRDRMAAGDALSFAEALALHSQVAYVERIVAAAVNAGDVVNAARAAESGWQDRAVMSLVAEVVEQASCTLDAGSLRSALEETGVADVDSLLALDAEMRAAVAIHGPAVDSAVCDVMAADRANSLFQRGLTIRPGAIPELVAPRPPAESPPIRLRILARLGSDGRIEHAVEMADGERILPTRRFLPASSDRDAWSLSSDVELDGVAIGEVRTRRLTDGRVELTFRPAEGDPIVPELRYLPADVPAGVWLQSSEIEVPTPGSMLE